MRKAEVVGKVKVKKRERERGGVRCLEICAHSRAAAAASTACSSGHSLIELELVAAIALTMIMPESKEASQVAHTF